MTIETRCFDQKLEFQRYPPKYFCTARYEHKSFKKFQTFRKPRKKKILGRSWAKIGPRKTQPNVCSPVLDRHRATKPTTAPRNLNGARPLGAPTHPLVTVFTKRPVIGGGRRQASDTNTFGRCCVKSMRQKFSIPLRWQKIGLLSGLEERRTPRATSRPLDHGST